MLSTRAAAILTVTLAIGVFTASQALEEVRGVSIMQMLQHQGAQKSLSMLLSSPNLCALTHP